MIAAGEEAGPKLVRLFYFVGAGFLCTAAINKWRDLERKTNLRKQQQSNSNGELLLERASDVVQKAVE